MPGEEGVQSNRLKKEYPQEAGWLHSSCALVGGEQGKVVSVRAREKSVAGVVCKDGSLARAQPCRGTGTVGLQAVMQQWLVRLRHSLHVRPEGEDCKRGHPVSGQGGIAGHAEGEGK